MKNSAYLIGVVMVAGALLQPSVLKAEKAAHPVKVAVEKPRQAAIEAAKNVAAKPAQGPIAAVVVTEFAQATEDEAKVSSNSTIL